MKFLGWLLAVCLIFMSSFDFQQYSAQSGINILSRIGYKAHQSFVNDIRDDVDRVTQFGYNRNISASSPEIIASFGGAFLQVGLTAETLNIVSDNVNDDVGGTGATNILIYCIDENGLEVQVPVVMDGANTVTTTQTCKFVNRAVVFLAGSARTNEGTITISQSSSGVVLAEIPAIKSATQSLMYYVPDDKRCYIDKILFTALKLSGGQAPRLDVNFLVYSQTQNIIYGIRELLVDTSVDNRLQLSDFKAEQLRPNEIFTMAVTTTENNTETTGSIELTCVTR